MLFYCCIIIGTTMVSVAYAETSSKQAISSQSYERGDVPLFYKHDVIHVYTTKKPHVYSDHQPQQQYQHIKVQNPTKPQIENYRHIQYAPLPLKNLEHYKGSDSETDTYDANNENNVTSEPQLEQTQKNYIDPQIVPTQASNFVKTDFVQYGPGYNVNLQSLNNQLIQNRLYGNPNLLIKNKQVNVNYMQPLLSHHIPERPQDVRQNADFLVTQQYSKPNAIYTILGHQFVKNDKKYNGNIVQSNESSGELKPIIYVKESKVSLNVARNHNIAHAPNKAPLNIKSSFRKLPSLPQDFFKSLIVESPNTHMHPSPNKNIYMIHHTM